MKIILIFATIFINSINADYFIKQSLDGSISESFNVQEASYFVFNKNQPTMTRSDQRTWNSPAGYNFIDVDFESKTNKALMLQVYPNYDTDLTDRQGGNVRYRFNLPEGLKFNTMHYVVKNGCNAGSGHYAFLKFSQENSTKAYKSFASNQGAIGWQSISFENIIPTNSDNFYFELETYQYPVNFTYCRVNVLLENKIN